MIISGGKRSNWRKFAPHLMNTELGEQRVRVVEIRGLAAETLVDAFHELEALGMGTRAKNFYYHANVDPRADEHMTEEQWEQAVDSLEEALGFSGHSRFVVEHEKHGRTHRHVVWSRVNDDMKVVRCDWNYAIHQRTADELEKAFGHEKTPRQRELGQSRGPDNWEYFRGKKSRISPKDVETELSELWRHSDTGQAFAAALSAQGYILARGDRRDFVVIDAAGDDHSLGRRVGAKPAEVRARMADVDREQLPSVEAARKLARERAAQRGKDAPDAPLPDFAPDPEPGTRGPGGAGLMLPAPERTKFDQLVAQFTEPAGTARELRAFERSVEQWQLAYREAVGDGSFIAEGIDWLARKLGLASGSSSPPDRELTPFDQVVEETKEALRDNGGEPYSPDGTSFWQRAAATLRELGDRTVSWVRDRFDTFVGRLTAKRHAEREHEPDLER